MKVSVIVPVFNVEKYLRRCLDSILGQTYKNIEILLVDDGSTDLSGKICDEYAKKDNRVVVIHKKNGGLSSARNAGMKKSRGDFVCFVDSDDDVKNNYVECLIGLIEKYKVELSVACYTVVTSSGKTLGERGKYFDKKMSKEDALGDLLREDIFTVSANAKMYSRRLCRSISFPEGMICEDNGTTYKFFMESNGIAFGNINIYNYYKNPGSIMTEKFSEKKLDLVVLVDKMCDDIARAYPVLNQVASRKKIIARFSILRQIEPKEADKKEKKIVRQMRQYILKHKKEILTQKEYSFRDRVALLSLILGWGFFHLIWKIYSLERYA